jgi:hypothetical protein
MSNVLTDIGHGIKVGVEDIGKVAEDVITIGGKVIKVISELKALSPSFKQELSTLVNDVEKIAGPLAPVIASGGTNVAVDATALEPVVVDVIQLVKDFLSFLPTLDAAIKEIGGVIESAPATATAPATTT